MTFNYTVGASDTSLDLDALTLFLNQSTITRSGNPVALSIPAGLTPGSLASTKNLSVNLRMIDTLTPTTTLTDSNTLVNISVGTNVTSPTIDASDLITGGTGLLPAMEINSPTTGITVSVPATTTVSSDPRWEGTIDIPSVTDYILPPTSGKTKTLGLALTMGDTTYSLEFDKAIRIKFPLQAGKIIGYQKPG